MDRSQQVADILKWYDLPAEEKEKIRKFVEEIQATLPVNRLVLQLVDQYQLRQPRMLPLDSPENLTGHRLAYEASLASTPSPPPEERHLEPLTIGEAVKELLPRLLPAEAQVLRDLSARRSVRLSEYIDVTREEIQTNAARIQLRIESLINHFRGKSGVVIPHRTPKYIQFEPEFRIILSANPIKAAEENERVEALRDIQAAYEATGGNAAAAARKTGYSRLFVCEIWKLAGLLPRGNRLPRLAGEIADAVLGAYAALDGNASEAWRQFGQRPKTVIAYWRRAGLEPKGKSTGNARRLPPDEVQRIIDTYGPHKGNATHAGKVGHTRATVIKTWRKAGLETRGRGSPVLKPHEIADVTAAYTTFEGNASAAARKMGRSASCIIKYWRAAGLEPTQRLTEEEIRELVAYHPICKGSAIAAARDFGYSISTVTRHWQGHGLAYMGNDGQRVPPKGLERILAAHARYEGNAARAAERLGYSNTTILRYWKEVGLAHAGIWPRLSNKDVKRIVSIYARFKGNASRAADKLGYSPKTIRKYWRQHGKVSG